MPEPDLQFGPLTVAPDVSAGQWAIDATGPWGTVTALVPGGFEAYARIFHPAEQWMEHDTPAGLSTDPNAYRSVRWAEVAEANGRVAHSAMQWPSITGSYRFLKSDTQPPLWHLKPEIGSLTPEEVRVLVGVLGGHTTTPEQCCFAIWEGFNDSPHLASLQSERLMMPGRGMILLNGPLAELPNVSLSEDSGPPPYDDDDVFFRSPSLWWPEDRAWCVGTDVDLDSSFVAGSAACVAELVSDQRLEVLQVGSEHSLAFASDHVNPKPEGSLYH